MQVNVTLEDKENALKKSYKRGGYALRCCARSFLPFCVASPSGATFRTSAPLCACQVRAMRNTRMYSDSTVLRVEAVIWDPNLRKQHVQA
ncbi:hypothetical protein INR49_013773 [Caranx melampygus]|nr:hypothetical protein INR49_013773 [Caranx melampygus]